MYGLSAQKSGHCREVAISGSLTESQGYDVYCTKTSVKVLHVHVKREERSFNLRSCAMGIMLQTPRILTKKTLGDCAFLAAAPKLWNGLPSQIRNEPNFHRFKGLLKSHFFRLDFY